MKTTSVHVKILSIILPIVAIIIIVMMVVSYHINFKTQKSFFESCMQELSAKSAQEVTSKLATMTEELKWMANEDIFTSMDDKKYSKRLETIAAEKKEYFSMMFVAYPDGSYYINGKGFSKANIADRQYFKNIFQRGYDFMPGPTTRRCPPPCSRMSPRGIPPATAASTPAVTSCPRPTASALWT